MSNYLCSMLGHKPPRAFVRRSDDVLVGRCRRCMVRLKRTESGWQERRQQR